MRKFGWLRSIDHFGLVLLEGALEHCQFRRWLSSILLEHRLQKGNVVDDMLHDLQLGAVGGDPGHEVSQFVQHLGDFDVG